MVVVFGQPQFEKIVLVLDLGEPDSRHAGEDQRQEYEHDVMAVKIFLF